jgi:hypothetical protein
VFKYYVVVFPVCHYNYHMYLNTFLCGILLYFDIDARRSYAFDGQVDASK